MLLTNLGLAFALALKPGPVVAYTLTIDPADSANIRVAMVIQNATTPITRVAMAVHPEYNDRFWRYVRDLRAEVDGRPVAITGEGDHSWRVPTPPPRGSAASRPGSKTTITYRIALPPENSRNRAVWHTAVRSDGASINPIDTFLYLADYPRAYAAVGFHIPSAWQIVSGLSATVTAVGTGTQCCLGADRPLETATLLDTPILIGAPRSWSFSINGSPVEVAYWALPNAARFDTTAFIAAIRKVATEAAKVFGGNPPFPRYAFLIEDGAWGALEHASSVTLGMPSADLARDPHAYLGELAHEFFHAWNLVRLYPEGRGHISDREPEHATGLWLSEGLTMYYAEVLTRRAGFPERGLSRAALLSEELEAYFANPGNTLISPEVASAREVDTTGINGDLEPNYYVQGRVIGTALDIAIRDSTHGERGLDDFMRAMYSRFAMKRGFTSSDVERTASGVCSCNLRRFFDDYVRNARPVDINRYLGSVGLRAVIDTVPAADSTGSRLADLRVWAYPPRQGGRMRVMIQDPSSVWARAGLHTGDELVALNGAAVDSLPDFRRALRRVRIGDVVALSIIRRGRPALVNVRVIGYDRVRVRVREIAGASAAQRERRRLWLSASPDS
jgi:predicted metalloprotease with PDZ domain